MTTEHVFFVGKLIRDKVCEIDRALGISPCEHIMEMDEYLERLKEKLIEEATEVIEASSAEELIVELADLTEVIHAIAATKNFTPQDIENARLIKKMEKGGFEGRVFNSHTFVKADHPEISYFRTSPHKYPEIKQPKK